MTQVTTIGSVPGHGTRGGLPPDGGRLRKALRIGGSLPRLSFPDAMAGRVPLSALRRSEGMAGALCTLAMRKLWVPSLVDSGDDVSGHAHSLEGLVPRPVVDDQPEERCQRPGSAACVGARKLPNRVVLDAQTETGHGEAGPGSTVRNRRGRRGLRGSSGRGYAWPQDPNEGTGCCGGARGWPGDRRHSDAAALPTLRPRV